MKIPITPHQEWMSELLDYLKLYENKVVNHRYFQDMANGTLSIERFHRGLIYFYPLIEAFPKYMALNLAKVPAADSGWNSKTRSWLITNMNVERVHTVWWRQWAEGFGVSKDVLDEEIHPPAEMDAINNYLWRICTHGSLAEGVSATNYAVEGPTGQWTISVKEGLRKYQSVEGLNVNKKTVEWVAGHADYDDRHPYEALEIIKAYATTQEEQNRVKQAAKRAMEYYAMALDDCYDGAK